MRHQKRQSICGRVSSALFLYTHTHIFLNGILIDSECIGRKIELQKTICSRIGPLGCSVRKMRSRAGVAQLIQFAASFQDSAVLSHLLSVSLCVGPGKTADIICTACRVLYKSIFCFNFRLLAYTMMLLYVHATAVGYNLCRLHTQRAPVPVTNCDWGQAKGFVFSKT